jgi:putative nucleotidyltransferase with HDIG domain
MSFRVGIHHPRRKERVKRRRSHDGRTQPRWLILAARTALFFAVPLLAHLLFPLATEESVRQIREGDISEKEIIAPFTFPVRRDPTELERARSEAARAVPPVLDFDVNLAGEAVQKLHRLGRELQRPPSESLPIGELKSSLARRYGLELSAETIALLRTAEGQRVLDQGAQSLGRMLNRTIVDSEVAAILVTHDVVNIRRGSSDFYRPSSEVLTESNVAELVTAAASEVEPANSEARNAFVELVRGLLDPNTSYNRAETERRITAARAEVPELAGMVHRGERILDSHERVTAEQVRKLESLGVYRQEMEIGGRFGGGLLAALGRIGVICLLILAFLVYLRRLHPRIYGDLRSLALLTTLGAMGIIGAYLVVDRFQQPELLVPMALIPLLAAVLVGRGVALFLAFMGPVLLVSLKGFGPEFLVASSVSGMAAVLTSVNLKHRHQLYVPVLVVGGINLLVSVTLGLGQRAPASEILLKGVLGIMNAMLAGMLALAILPVLEKLFRITTNFTLIELLDRNHPLLKRMAIEAPGTFHHSMLVSELAREAAEAAGGNSLLAQVGAYYHDIGKMQMPEYFIENQTGKNRHDSLTPTMSCLILGSHVRDGLQMAREARLPSEIISFIPEHHGTNLMSYFYHKAMERDPNVEEQDFRYPGPSPGRKETAIVMLADSVEATARSLDDPTPGKIRSIVKQIIDLRAAEGQLDDSGLTLADLAKVRESFVTVLDRFFHLRIAYPEAALRALREDGVRRFGPQGEEVPARSAETKREVRRTARRGVVLADGTESLAGPRLQEGDDAHSRARSAAASPDLETRAPDDRPSRARGS